jgi:RecA-family ATPase
MAEEARARQAEKGSVQPHTHASRHRNAADNRTSSQASSGICSEPFPLIAVRDIPEIVEQDWLVEGVLPRNDREGSAGYIFGPEKTRKSLFLADVALSIATGTPALVHFAVRHPGAAVGFFAEDAKGETSRRLHRLARARGVAVPSHLRLIDIPSLSLTDPDHQQRLLRTLRGVEDLKFVWLDPMVRLHSVDDNRANELAPIHTFLRVLSRACPQAVLALSHHTNKLGGSRGSTDFPAFGDFNLFLRRVDPYTSEVFRLDNRGGPPGTPFRYRAEDGRCDAGATLRLVVADATPAKEIADDSDRAEEIVRRLMADNPRCSQRDAKMQLKAEGLRVGSDRFQGIWKRVKQ